jgi:hypothetical protein
LRVLQVPLAAMGEMMCRMRAVIMGANLLVDVREFETKDYTGITRSADCR